MSAGVQADSGARARALDPTRSFVVQAPAGSGKTTVLVQRFLKLLAVVAEPEEILAITFTRKAAAEMRRRIVEALDAALSDLPCEQPHDQRTRELARVALARDAERGWALTRHASRLRIATIDATNSGLAGRAPVSSGASALRRITENPWAVYREAARETLASLAETGEAGESVRQLLRHLDAQSQRAAEVLAQMLARREQWLPLVLAWPGQPRGAVRAELEGGLARVIEHELRALEERVPARLRDELDACLAIAQQHLGATERRDRAADVAAGVSYWQAAAAMLLKADGDWRRRLDRRNGFPSSDKQARARATQLIAGLAEVPGLQAALRTAGQLPLPVYPDDQWRTLEALIGVLPLAAAQLKLAFARRGEADFQEVAAEACNALGTADDPSALGLRVDLRVQHILVDEFQDTSASQAALLRGLTRDWQSGDGRTIFLVGDPMQSIYRFRRAEVGLYLSIRDAGLGTLPLEPLQLVANFRSDPVIVEWINEAFQRVFPAHDDLLTGQVAFAASAPALGAGGQAEVRVHDQTGCTRAAAAAEVVRVVRDTLTRRPGESIGVLVRSRAHARELVPALRAAGIPFGAVDLLRLADTTVAHDLLALTRALLHAGDRLAWLAVLRAPWCGLTLADLATLAEDDWSRTIWELSGDPRIVTGLSSDGQRRLQRCRDVLARAWVRRGRVALRDLVEGAWLELGGPATAVDQLDYARLFFERLDGADRAGDCADVLGFGDQLAERAASVGHGEHRVQLMTIHKAKGLEFDSVLLPGLGYGTRRDERPPLLWTDYPLRGGQRELLLAPVNPLGAASDPLYELLWRLHREQGAAELDRLLYVAATRARRRLHLFARGETRDGQVRAPRQTLAERLWPAIAGQMGPRAVTPDAGPPALPLLRQLPLRRLRSAWRPPPLTAAWTPSPDQGIEPEAEPMIFDWAGRTARQVGVVVHQWLQYLAECGPETITAQQLEAWMPRARRMLGRAGVPDAELEPAVRRVEAALRGTLADPRGRWVLSSAHPAAASEAAFTVVTERGVQRVVLDRTFVDEEGTRWVVDFKTSMHEGGNLEAFLASEVARYRDQLQLYRQVFLALGESRIRTALYFPLLGRFLEIPPDGQRG